MPTETLSSPSAPASSQASTPAAIKAKSPLPRRAIAIVLILAIVVAAILLWGIPEFLYSLNHVSTDDAMVNSHTTLVSPRINGQVTEVLVDDNQFVNIGDPLIRLDPTMLKLNVDQKRAELEQAKLKLQSEIAQWEVAKADLEQSKSQVRGQLAGVRAMWYLVATVQDFVRYEIASLMSGVANVNQQEANLHLAQAEYDRALKLGSPGVSQEEIETRKAALDSAEAQVTSAQEAAQQTRALLGLPNDTDHPATVPSDVARNFNGMRYAAASFEQTLIQLGLNVDLNNTDIASIKDKFLAMNSDQVVNKSPSVLAAQARVLEAQAVLGGDMYDPAHPETQPDVARAQAELNEAQLQLGYSEIRAPIAGYISRRNVNPGTHVAEGQSLLAIRPLADVWIDANFKETQLVDLRIGQAVELYVDAYPNRVFHGRVAGFSAGTGATMSLLPPENATGNFVKVVQRLPVRIELTEPNPTDTPLLAGLSVVPEVDIKTKATGPDAGARLLTSAQSSSPSNSPSDSQRAQP